MKKPLILLALALLVAASYAGAAVTRSSAPALAIGPAADCANNVDGTGGGTDTIAYPETGTISDVNVRVEIDHTWRSDLQFHVAYSVGAAGNVTLAADHAGSGDDYYATFDDEGPGLCNSAAFCDTNTNCNADDAPGPTCQPDVALTAFDGLTSPGTWTFQVCDDAGGDGGTLNLWEMTVDGMVGDGLPVELVGFGVE